MAKVFVDTNYVIALVNRRDQHHTKAVRLAAYYDGRPLLTTEAVLLEIGNGLARRFKPQGILVIEHFLGSGEVEIVRLTPELFEEGFALYRSYADKEWGLVDCISFVVMRRAGATEALTTDGHFTQAGFRCLLA